MNYPTGIVVPVATPFNEDQSINFDMLSSNIKKWNQTDIAGYMSLGSNSEFTSLDDEESLDVLETIALLKGSKYLIAGAGRESLLHTCRFIDKIMARNIAVDYISILTPHYFRKAMTDDALVAYFTAVADHSPLPVLLYCAPAYANSVVISPEVLRRLADHTNIAGIKDTTPDMMDRYLDAVGGRDDFVVFAGSVGNIMPCLARGGKGGILSAANYYPQQCAHLMRVFEEEGLERAKVYHAILYAFAKRTGGSNGVASLKACMNLCGFQAGIPRLPMQPLSPESVEEMRKVIETEWPF